MDSINRLENVLKENIIGQDKAIKELVDITKKIKMGYSNHKLKSFLFVGPTGVGKTNLVKLYAKELVGENNLIRLDMSEYADSTAVNKIIGSSPGYVGYSDNNNILDKLKDRPNAILLLDEIDKAHPQVINLLYQVLDEGYITDSRNNTINLNNNMVIMTSNLGFEESRVGFNKNVGAKSSLLDKFPSSLINRIDSIITFNYLKQDDIRVIVEKRLNCLKDKYPEFSYSSKLVDDIIKECEYQEFGARRIEKIIDKRVESVIIDKMLASEKLYLDGLMEYQI